MNEQAGLDTGRDAVARVIYNAISGHSWMGLRGCQCGWTKPPHSVGHHHHLAQLAAEAIHKAGEQQ